MMSQITLPLNIKSLEILSQRVDAAGNIVLTVRSTNDDSVNLPSAIVLT